MSCLKETHRIKVLYVMSVTWSGGYDIVLGLRDNNLCGAVDNYLRGAVVMTSSEACTQYSEMSHTLITPSTSPVAI